MYISCVHDQIWGKTRKMGHEYSQCMGRLKHFEVEQKVCESAKGELPWFPSAMLNLDVLRSIGMGPNQSP